MAELQFFNKNSTLKNIKIYFSELSFEHLSFQYKFKKFLKAKVLNYFIRYNLI